MEIRNIRNYALEIAATGQVVEPGATAEIEDEALAVALLDQPDNWTLPDGSSPVAAEVGERPDDADPGEVLGGFEAPTGDEVPLDVDPVDTEPADPPAETEKKPRRGSSKES